MIEFLIKLDWGQWSSYSFGYLIFTEPAKHGETPLDEQAHFLTLHSREEGGLWTLITGMINVIF